MATIPTLTIVKAYIGSDTSWSDAEIDLALAAQREDQAKKVTFPTPPVEDPTWVPEALATALCRRTQVALSLQPLPLGVQVTMSDYNAATTRLGSPSKDPLVADLERPYRKLVIG
jgi:hypothetical protein